MSCPTGRSVDAKDRGRRGGRVGRTFKRWKRGIGRQGSKARWSSDRDEGKGTPRGRDVASLSYEGGGGSGTKGRPVSLRVEQKIPGGEKQGWSHSKVLCEPLREAKTTVPSSDPGRRVNQPWVHSTRSTRKFKDPKRAAAKLGGWLNNLSSGKGGVRRLLYQRRGINAYVASVSVIKKTQGGNGDTRPGMWGVRRGCPSGPASCRQTLMTSY